MNLLSCTSRSSSSWDLPAIETFPSRRYICSLDFALTWTDKITRFKRFPNVFFRQKYISVYHQLWNAKTEKKRARECFRVFGLKKKVIDKFFKSMDGPDKPLILYGAGKSVPVESMSLLFQLVPCQELVQQDFLR
jgi:hypothetical protein